MTTAARVTRVSAYAVCAEHGRILLARIAPGYTDAFDGWWTLPGGGTDHGEHPRDAAIRELREETGLVGEVVELLDVDSWRKVLRGRDGVETDYHGVRILYRCRVVGGELRNEVGGSTDECRWFSAEELPRETLGDIAEVAVSLIGLD